MSAQIEDILNAICSEVQQTHSNEFQRVFVLGDAKEAKLAFDILIAYGLDAKVYREPGKPSKLYVTHPTMPPEQLEQSLASALAYARTLKQIKQSLDSLSQAAPNLSAADYTMSFVNAQPQGKQIMIHMAPPPGAQPQPAQAMPPQPPKAAAKPAAAAARRPAQAGKNVISEKKHYEELTSGPAVGRSYGGIKGIDPDKQDTATRRAMLYLSGNIATSSFAFLIMVVGIGILVSLFIFSKAFLCPDFAVAKKNRAWYCKVFSDDANEKKKQQQQQQQQLQPQP